MKKIFVILLVMTFPLIALSQTGYVSKIESIPPSVQAVMKQYTWHPGCPVPLADLAYVTVTYWGFDHQQHQGPLVVNRAVAPEVVSIFGKLYQQHFPIQHIALMDDYHGSDDAALLANNTSAFNCREVTNQPGVFSQHSYGRAIDINPFINPYVKGTQVLPATAAKYVDRKQAYPGKITRESFIYQQFSGLGWDWGGLWYDVQDYQHFEKRANGEKRNPHGYAKN